MQFLRNSAIAFLLIACAPPPGALPPKQIETKFVTSRPVADVVSVARRALADDEFDPIKADSVAGTVVAERPRMASEAAPHVACAYSQMSAATRNADMTLKLKATAQGDSTLVVITSKVLSSDRMPTALAMTRSNNLTDCHSSGVAEEHIRSIVNGRPIAP